MVLTGRRASLGGEPTPPHAHRSRAVRRATIAPVHLAASLARGAAAGHPRRRGARGAGRRARASRSPAPTRPPPRAALLTARALPNPTLAASYSKSAPQKHLVARHPGVRRALDARRACARRRTASARAARLLLRSRSALPRSSRWTPRTPRPSRRDARFRLSRQTARDADSLRQMTVRRRDAGDASELDVDLATVVAGQQLNVAANDSLAYMSALLTVQTLMGIAADSAASCSRTRCVCAPRGHGASSVAARQRSWPRSRASPATAWRRRQRGAIAAAEATLPRPSWRSRSSAAACSRRRRSARRRVGRSGQRAAGCLPLIGVAIPLPLFDRNGADRRGDRRARAGARRSSSRRGSRCGSASWKGCASASSCIAKVARDRDLVVRAQRVADVADGVSRGRLGAARRARGAAQRARGARPVHRRSRRAAHGEHRAARAHPDRCRP